MENSFVRSALFNNGTYDKKDFLFRDHVQPGVITNFQNRTLTRQIQFSGNPIIRYFFRVKGLADMTGWDGTGEWSIDEADPVSNFNGNSFFISSTVLRPQTQTEKINIIGTDDSVNQINLRTFYPPWVEVNRTMDPDGFDVKGCYLFDRIVSVSGIAAPIVTFTLGARFDLASLARARFLNGGSPAGNYSSSAGAVVLGDEIRSENKTFFFGNPTSVNPRSLYDDESGSGMFTDSSINSAPLNQRNIVEAVYLGCRAEESIRDEKITDLSAPILTTDFDA